MSSNRLSTYANVVISTPTDVFRVKDIKDFVKLLNVLQVPDDTVLDDGFLVYEYQTENIDLISCGEHLLTDQVYDFLVSTHTHKGELK